MAHRVPNFFIVGAPKSGTTALYHTLDQHPDVFMSPIKEPCVFAPEVVDLTPRARERFDADAADLRAYLAGPMCEKRTGIVLEWSDYLKLFKNVAEETAVGEASVAYLGSLYAAREIRARVPDARIVMMLRDPVKRLLSHYTAASAAGATRAGFITWVDEQVAIERGRSVPWGPVWAGRYAVHLERYHEHFPRSRVRVFLYDDYMRSPRSMIRDLLAFLDVDSTRPLDVQQRHNVTRVPRWPRLHHRVLAPISRPLRALVPAAAADRARRWMFRASRRPVTGDERRHVLAIYADDIRALETRIERDLSSWRSGEGES